MFTPYTSDYALDLLRNRSKYTIGLNYSQIKLRRSSDDATQTFKPAIGWKLDTVSILAWSGSDSVYVEQINDFTGNGNHSVQTTTAEQPRIVNAGTFEVDSNGDYAMYFDGTDDHFDITDNQGLDITSGGLSILAKHDPDILTATYLISRNAGDSANFQYGIFCSTTSLIRLNGVNYSSDTSNTLASKITAHTYDDVNTKAYLNGSLVDTDAFSDALISRANMQIGCRSNSADGSTKSLFYQGHISSIAIFDKALSQSQITILTNRLT